MKIRITAEQLTDRQWDYLRAHPLGIENIPDGAVRACVMFLRPPVRHGSEHVEMTVRTFMALVERLRQVETATAVLGSDELPDHLRTVRNAADSARAAVRDTYAVRDAADSYRPGHDDECESEFITEAGMYSPCRCGDR